MLQVTDSTLTKNLDGFIEHLASIHDVKPPKLDADMVGIDYFSKKIQWGATITEEQYTLGYLAELLEHDSSICQFEINEAKVKAILFGPNGIAKKKTHQPLYMLPELLVVRNKKEGTEEVVIGGGRHRITAMLLLMQGVEGWEDMVVRCLVRTCKSMDEVRSYIEHSNGSRTMSAAEKTQLDLGVSVATSSATDMFTEAAKLQSNYTKAKQLYSFGLGRSLFGLRMLKVRGDKSITANNALDIGKAVILAVTKAIAESIKAIDPAVKSSQIAKLLTTPTGDDGPSYLQIIAEELGNWITLNWNALYMEHCQVVMSGKVGYNVGKGVKGIAQATTEYAMSSFEENLVEAYQAYIQLAQAESAQKEQAKIAKAEANAKAQAIATIKVFMKTPGIDQAVINQLMVAAGVTEEDLERSVTAKSARKPKAKAPVVTEEYEVVDADEDFEESDEDEDFDYEE